MKLLLYCTKGKPYLYQGFAKPMHTLDRTNPFNYKWGLTNKPISNIKLNGKIVAECDFEVEEIEKKCVEFIKHWYTKYCYITKKLNEFELMNKSQLDGKAINKYLNGNKGSAIYIKNLHIFDEPKELSDYYTFDSKQHININYCKPIIKAPQNMMYCWSLWQDSCVIGNRYFYENILISIRPEWLCKILNGEKTIEIRKKVLKKML